MQRYRNYYDRILQQGREIGFSSEHGMDKWQFTAKEQGGGQWMEITEETSEIRRCDKDRPREDLLIKGGA